ncbi:MAG: hypothetical protein ACLRMJ_09615 [Alistipes finegoldii]
MECDNSVNPVGNRPRLLVAEDNPSNYKLVEVLLRRDYELVHAWDGRRPSICRRYTPIWY